MGCLHWPLRIRYATRELFNTLADFEGANVRTKNIFKMTPEMRSLLDDAPEQTPFGIFDESPPNALARSDVNVVASQSQSTTDPFSVSKNRVNAEIRSHTVNPALYEKMNNTNNIITPLAMQEIAVDETPTGNGGILDPNFFSKPNMNEPPLAPVRKGRGVPGIGLDVTTDAPPKMRTNSTLRSKSRTNVRSEDQEDVGSKQPLTNHSSDLKRTISGKAAHTTASTARSSVVDPAVQQRKSVRLLNQLKPSSRSAASNQIGSIREEREMRKAKAPSSKARSANSFNVGRVVSGNRKHEPMDVDGKEQRPPGASNVTAHQTNPKPVVNEQARETEALQWLLELVHKLGTGYSLLSQYQCQDALLAFQTIPTSQRETPWVLAQIGRAYYEQAAYADAEKIFSRIRSMSPSRLEDMEYYSTSLWHLKQDVDLAFLSHELVDLDRLSPQAWCAVGNSCSLQRDHDQALKCFKRATQLDPAFAYAYTLQGHEYVQNEEYDKAMSAYRAAITAENRHYNAWYGLGRVFEKQGRYPVAEHHYRTAQQINPTNAVLITCIGVMLEKQKNLKAALVKYSEACQISEKGTLWRFKKARVLVALGQPERALLELRVLKDIAPDEANVHFSLGSVYKRLGQKGEAIRHFTMALNLDPKVRPFKFDSISGLTIARHHLTSKKPWKSSITTVKTRWTCDTCMTRIASNGIVFTRGTHSATNQHCIQPRRSLPALGTWTYSLNRQVWAIDV